MDKVHELIDGLIGSGTFVQATLSGLRRKDPEAASKIKIKPTLLKAGLVYQFASQCGPKVLHENVDPGAVAGRLAELLASGYKQLAVQAADADYQILMSSKGKPSILKRQATAQAGVELAHNRRKRYVLEEGTPVPFLVELGVMNGQGKVLAAKYDKFRQINRFLEMIDDVLPHLPEDRPVHVVDFGCGKSYLTFALYHYLHHIQGREVRMTGLDLKQDVITHCSDLARRLQYDHLQFLVGDIGRYDGMKQVDMVVTLHACDTATDAALDKAVRWDARVILSVPCCQHELNRQIECAALTPMLQHGIIKERMAALATDSLRAQLLDLLGYKAQILEFIDMEHTPKNLLIRAVRHKRSAADSSRLAAQYLDMKRLLHVDPYLERALSDRLQPLLDGSRDA